MMTKKADDREAEFEVSDIFIKRWSARAMSGKAISNDELMMLFEAAKWAPSAFNNQPWRFLYAKKDTKEWDVFFDLLVEANQAWCKNAGVLVVVLSKTTFDHNSKPDNTHRIGTGAAWENLALQGSILDLVVHGMAGFDYEKAKKELAVPDDYEVQMMIAIGKPGKKEDLPEALQNKESPSERKKISEIAAEGKFNW